MADITGDGINDFDITTAGSSVTIGGVTFTDAVNVGSGTGGYNTFLAISDNDGIEEGFNSDDTPPIDTTNKDIDQAKTHTVLLSSLVIVTVNVNGVPTQFYQVRVDLNESNNDPNAQISLDEFQVYTSTSGTIESTTNLFNPANATLKYDMDAGGDVSVLLSDAESSGSGTDDYSVLIPVSTFAGQDPSTTYVYFYIKMGAAGADWDATSTFEEWNLENGVTLTGTKFNDIDGDGIKDAGEGPVAGVTIFIDANKNGVFDAGERSTVTDANGNYSFFGVSLNQTVWIDEVVPAGATQTTGAHEEIVISANASPGSTLVVDPIGNHTPVPDVHLEKDASVPGGTADTAGEVISYTLAVTNPGEVPLTGVVITDPYADAGSIQAVLQADAVHNIGDIDDDNQLDLTETWSYTATHTVTQGEIDSNGGGDGELENTATVNTDQGVSDDDDASVPLDQNPAIAIEKTATLDDGGDCVDQDGDIINYTYSVTNAGNVALDNVVVVDDKVTVVADDANNDTFNDGDTDLDGLLDVNETWTYSASYTATQDDIDSNGDGDGFIHNNVTANGDAAVSGEAALEATDDADVEVCPAPAIAIEKTAALDDGGDCVDQDGDIINYTYSVTNAGNVALDNVVVVDDKVTVVADDADNDTFNDGDTDLDGLLDVNETWTYSASYTATQDDIDSNGDGDGFIHNNVTANGDAAVSGEAALEATDDADVEVCPAPAIAIEKTAALDDGGDCVDQDGDIINYTYSVTNAGNVALDNVVVVDDKVTVVADDADNDTFNDGDTDLDGLLDVNETWTYSASYTATQDDIDSNGDGDGFIHNNVTANGDAAVSGEAALEATDDADVEVCPAPAIAIEKTAALDDGGDCVDQDGDIINYTYSVTNAGNVALDNVVVVDDKVTVVADDADNDTFNDGDTDLDGLLDVNETWTYSASYTATQDDIDSNGDGDGFIHNNVTANGDAAVSGEAALEATDDADVEVCQLPGIDLEKYVSVDSTDGTDGTFVDADDSLGPQNVNLGADVWFQVTVANTGNLTLTDVDIVDDNQTGGGSVTFDLMQDGALTADAVNNHSATLDGDDGDGLLEVGETWTITYRQAFDPGEHLNVATVTTAEGQTDDDAAYYFSLVDEGLCPRTPGFWQNPKNGGQFWDGVAGNEKHLGEDGFPEGELLYNVDSDHDGDIDANDQKGLLIGDYDKDGFTDADEDTLFVSYDDAQKLINASNKQLNGQSGDGKFMLGRDMIASWLNYLQGSGFGDASDPQSPHHYLDDAIDWMQIYAGNTAGGNNEIFDSFKLNSGVIKTSSAIWNTPQAGIDHSASQMHGALDYYNNTGQTSPTSAHYANCESQHLFEALSIYQQSHELI